MDTVEAFLAADDACPVEQVVALLNTMRPHVRDSPFALSPQLQ